MFANWFFGKGQKSRAARSTRARKDVLRRRNRLLHMESLEDRSLLSISTGLSDLSALSSPTALYASATSAATATQLAIHLPSQVTFDVTLSTLGSDTITATDSGNSSLTGKVTTDVIASTPPRV